MKKNIYSFLIIIIILFLEQIGFSAQVEFVQIKGIRSENTQTPFIEEDTFIFNNLYEGMQVTGETLFIKVRALGTADELDNLFLFKLFVFGEELLSPTYPDNQFTFTVIPLTLNQGYNISTMQLTAMFTGYFDAFNSLTIKADNKIPNKPENIQITKGPASGQIKLEWLSQGDDSQYDTPNRYIIKTSDTGFIDPGQTVVNPYKFISADTALDTTATHIAVETESFGPWTASQTDTTFFAIMVMDEFEQRSEITQIQIPPLAPVPVTTLALINGELINNTQPLLIWNPVPEAETYIINIQSADSYYDTSLSVSGSETSVRAPPLPQDDTYKWQVYAIDDFGNSAPEQSVYDTFILDATPPIANTIPTTTGIDEISLTLFLGEAVVLKKILNKLTFIRETL